MVGLPLGTVYSQDWDDTPRYIASLRHPEVKRDVLPRDAGQISEDDIKHLEQLHLVVLTPPCKDFSAVKKDKYGDDRAGLAGVDGHQMIVTLRIVEYIRKYHKNAIIVLENVIFKDLMPDWQVVVDAMGCYPHEIQAFTNCSNQFPKMKPLALI